MSKVKTKELIICIISLIILALAITTNVFATTVDNINELLGNNTNEFNDIENENVLNNTTNDVTNNTVHIPIKLVWRIGPPAAHGQISAYFGKVQSDHYFMKNHPYHYEHYVGRQQALKASFEEIKCIVVFG